MMMGREECSKALVMRKSSSGNRVTFFVFLRTCVCV